MPCYHKFGRLRNEAYLATCVTEGFLQSGEKNTSNPSEVDYNSLHRKPLVRSQGPKKRGRMQAK